MHQRRKFDFRGGLQLGFEDHVVTWTKPARPEWMDEETYAQVPTEMKIRELRFKIQKSGFRVNELVLVTTMLDAEEYTKEELADLFLQRWNIELDLRSIKDVLQMDVLRCKTPEMVEKEIWIHLLAYNLIRGVAAKAAEAHNKQPRRISFKGTLQTMTAFQEALRWALPPDRQRLVAEMLRAIAQHAVGDRPGREGPSTFPWYRRLGGPIQSLVPETGWPHPILVKPTPIWLPSWPPGPICSRRSAPGSWQWSR